MRRCLNRWRFPAGALFLEWTGGANRSWLAAGKEFKDNPEYENRLDLQSIELPSLTAVIQKDKRWYVSTCPELGVASQGKTSKEAYAMLAEEVESWLETASTKEIKRRLKMGRSVQTLELAHA